VARTGQHRLPLGDSQGFAGTVAGLGTGNSIDLTDVAFGASTTLGYSANGAGTGGMLSINDGSNSANIALLCNYIAGSFVAANDGHGGTVITDPATIASNQPQLTQSHA
jgi:hypothetical protein